MWKKDKSKTINTYKRLIIGSLILFSNISFSQTQGTSEINVSLGDATFEDFRVALDDVVSSIVTTVISGQELTYSDGGRLTGYTAHYGYAVKDRWMLGASLAYQTVHRKLLLDNKESGKSSSAVYSFGVETDYRYISNKSFQMYSGLGAGYAFGKSSFTLEDPNLEFKDKNKTDDKINYFTFHVTALGFRVGKKLAAFAEIGFGYKGILNGGISYQF
ncbi:hypothetical protein N9K49_04750 [Flavobacteriaceae bacterium]|nr:hypothetical protein [Flavobacteriaceae bacterium]